jgi:hypothetical protein
MRAVLPNLIFILPAVTLQRRILIFWFGPLGGLYECLEMLQGVWGRVPGASTSSRAGVRDGVDERRER